MQQVSRRARAAVAAAPQARGARLKVETSLNTMITDQHRQGMEEGLERAPLSSPLEQRLENILDQPIVDQRESG